MLISGAAQYTNINESSNEIGMNRVNHCRTMADLHVTEAWPRTFRQRAIYMAPQYLLRKSGLIGCAITFILLLGGCTLGQNQATPVPFDVTPYAPEASTTQASSDAATGEQVAAVPVEAESALAPAEADSINTPAAESVDVQPAEAILRYNGEIAAAHQVVVVAETAGVILTLDLDVGDLVEEGQPLAQIDTTLLEAQKAQALAGLEAAQAQLDLIQVEADPDDVAAAEAAVAAASAAYRRALAGATAEEQRLALAQLKQAEAAVTVAQAGYNQVKGNPGIAALPQSLQLQQATIGFEAAQAQYDKVLKGATEDVIAGAYAQLAQARAALQRLKKGPKLSRFGRLRRRFAKRKWRSIWRNCKSVKHGSKPLLLVSFPA